MLKKNPNIVLNWICRELWLLLSAWYTCCLWNSRTSTRVQFHFPFHDSAEYVLSVCICGYVTCQYCQQLDNALNLLYVFGLSIDQLSTWFWALIGGIFLRLQIQSLMGNVCEIPITAIHNFYNYLPHPERRNGYWANISHFMINVSPADNYRFLPNVWYINVGLISWSFCVVFRCKIFINIFTMRCYGIAAASRPLCPFVALRYCDHIGWNTSEIISRLISLRCSLSAEVNITGLLQGVHSEIAGGIR